jgi:hypothetical protein
VTACNQHLLPETRTLGGRLILDQRDPVERGGGECRGTGGYADLHSGVPVRALGADGTVLATGSLTAHVPAPAAEGALSEAERRRCVWTFSLPGLPPRDRYGVEIGERGEVSYTREELNAAGWLIEVSLGG